MEHMLRSFDQPIDVLVVGATGGLGDAFVQALSENDAVANIYTWSRSMPNSLPDRVCANAFDLQNEDLLHSAAERIARLNLIIVATGVLHNKRGVFPEKSLKDVNPDFMSEVLRTNMILPLLIAKHTVKLLPRRERTVFCCLSARVGSISDNKLGGWYSYRASKAALNQSIKCVSLELKRTHPDAICVGLHPGTVETRLFEPFKKNVDEDKLFSPSYSASQLLRVIDDLTPMQSGSVFAWDGKIIPP